MSRVLKSAVKYSVKTLSDRSKVTIGHTHDLRKVLFELRVKLQYNLLPLSVSMMVLLSGVYYYYLNEPMSKETIMLQFLICVCVRRRSSFVQSVYDCNRYTKSVIYVGCIGNVSTLLADFLRDCCLWIAYDGFAWEF